MNVNNNLKYNNSSVARLFRDSLAKKLLYNNHNIFKTADSFSIINNNWSYNIDATNEIVSNIANATKPYAYNTSDSKWYVKNNLGNYEQWGLMPTVSDLNNVTTYTGKLVILSTDSHEYKWNGTQWVDLGEGAGIKVGWLTTSNGNAWFEGDFDIRQKYIDNNYIKIQQTFNIIGNSNDRIWDGGLDSDGGWFSLDCPRSSDSATYYNIRNTVYIDLNGTQRTYTTTSGWSALEIKNGNLTCSNSSGQTYNRSITVAKSRDHNFSIFGRQPYHAGSFNLYNICIWTAENSTPYRNYYGSIDANNVPCIYEAVTGTYLYNLVSGQTLTFTETGTLPGGVPEEYPEKPAPTLSQTKASYQAALSGSYLNGQTVKVYNKTYDVSNGKLCESEITYPYITFDNTYTNNKIYGWLLRTDYPDAGSYSGWDIMFGSNMGSSEILPRMSSQYNGGVYTDLTFTDLSIKANLPTLSYNGHNWYYYYFQNTTGCYLQQGQAATTETNTYYTTYMMFITAPQN